MNENIVKMNSKDVIMFKLAHYFITEKDYKNGFRPYRYM